MKRRSIRPANKSGRVILINIFLPLFHRDARHLRHNQRRGKVTLQNVNGPAVGRQARYSAGPLGGASKRRWAGETSKSTVHIKTADLKKKTRVTVEPLFHEHPLFLAVTFLSTISLFPLDSSARDHLHPSKTPFRCENPGNRIVRDERTVKEHY